MHTAANRRAHLLRGIESIRTLAERADRNAIDRLLTHPAAASHLDDHTLDFLRHAQDLILITTQALTAALEPQGPPSRHGHRQGEAPAVDPVDAAEAWRRANRHLPGDHENPILIHIQEFEDGYQATPILVPIPEPPSIPNIETPTTLVIDKVTGTVTRWPLLRLNVLARQYRRYRRQAPMTFDDSE